MTIRFLERWRLHISTLGPVHIGTGDEYGPTDYVIDHGALYAFDAVGAALALPSAGRHRLLRIANGTPGTGMLKQVQGLFHDHRARFVPVATHAMPVAAGVLALYEERVGRTAQREESGREIINKLGIARTYTNPVNHDPVLLGSSVKGAIRTALLNEVNQGKALSAEERQLLESTRARDQATAHRELQIRLFRYRDRRGKLAFELDPMRLVHLSDAVYRSADSLAGTEVRFAVNRKKRPVKVNGQEVASLAEKGNLYQILETIPPLRYRAFSGHVNLQQVPDAPAVAEKLPSRDLRWTMADITEACNRFYWPKLENELRVLRERGFLDDQWGRAVESLVVAGLKERLDAKTAFVLRIGRHSGAEAVTLDGIRCIKIMRSREQGPEFADEARTWWLSAEETDARRSLLPFGWVLVELCPPDAQLAPWPAAEHAMRDYAAPYRAWRDALAERKAAAAAERARERAQEEELRAQAEAAQERAQRRAAMSEEELAVAELADWLEEDRAASRKDAGGRLANSLVNLLKRAEEDWQGPVCASLADLALDIYQFIGWPASKKKKERQALIKAVRDKAQ